MKQNLEGLRRLRSTPCSDVIPALKLAALFFVFVILALPNGADGQATCLDNCKFLLTHCHFDREGDVNQGTLDCETNRSTDKDTCKTEAADRLKNCVGLSGQQKADCEDSSAAQFKTCVKNADDDFKDCEKRWDRWNDQAYDRCERHDKECRLSCASTSGGAGRPIEPCPPGTSPNPLGVCEALIQFEDPRPEGEDGCPRGTRRGHDDRCYPILRIAVSPVADGYLIACPLGFRPSPIDGTCVPDDSGVTGADPGGVLEPRCPPGSEPGPRGDCVPKRGTAQFAAAVNLWFAALRQAEDPGVDQVEALGGVEGLALGVTDVVTALESFASSVGGELVDPEN